MTFPQESNHLTKWIFSAETLCQIRTQVNTLAKAQVEQLPSKKPIKVLTIEEEDKVVVYMGQQLLSLCQHKAIRPVIKETAVCFFRRFFLKRSVMLYDPRKIIFTCISLAIKAEDYARRYSVSSLFGDMVELDTQGVIKLELSVCEALDFHLLVLHTREPLLYLHNFCLEKLKNATRVDGATEKELHYLVGHDIVSRAEVLAISLQETDVPFLYEPNCIAVGCFIFFGRTALHGLLNIDDLVKEVYVSNGRANAYANLQPKIEAIQGEINKFRTVARERDPSEVGGLLKLASRIYEKLEGPKKDSKKKKRKKTEGGSVEDDGSTSQCASTVV